jgi:hypothetical protein
MERGREREMEGLIYLVNSNTSPNNFLIEISRLVIIITRFNLNQGRAVIRLNNIVQVRLLT